MNSSLLYRFSFNSCNKIKIATFIFPREYFNSSGGRPCMKRILLLGIVLAICILVMPQGVLANEITPDGVLVDASYAGSALTFTADKNTGEGAPSWPWALSENAADADAPWNLQDNALVFTVDSTLDWTVGATASDDGYMRTETTTVKPLLNNPFMIATDDGLSMTDLELIDLETTTTIETGIPADVGFSKDIDQKVVQADYSASDYKITLTFTCSNDWE